METTTTATAITIETTVNAPVEKVWKFWSEPAHIREWCAASDDWHVPDAVNDLKEGGKFKTTMAARDGSMSFDFEGVYSEVKEHESIRYTLGDGRKVDVHFTSGNGSTRIVETFDPESVNPVEMQRAGWQAILDNFRRYTEAN